LPPVKPSAFRIELPSNLSQWALWTSRSQMVSAREASPITARQSFGFEVALSPAPLEGRRMGLFDRLYWTLREAFALLAPP
jgi:hypothetical protein